MSLPEYITSIEGDRKFLELLGRELSYNHWLPEEKHILGKCRKWFLETHALTDEDKKAVEKEPVMTAQLEESAITPVESVDLQSVPLTMKTHPSGIVTLERTEAEPPKRDCGTVPVKTMRYFAQHYHRVSDAVNLIRAIVERRAGLVGVMRHGPGGILENQGCVVTYYHYERIEVEVKT